MRVLTNMTLYSGPNVSGTSMYNAMQDWCRAWSDLYPNQIYVYLILPKKDLRGKWLYDESELDFGNVKILPASTFAESTERSLDRDNWTIFPSSDEALYYYPLNLKWYYDVFLDLRISHACYMKRMLNYGVRGLRHNIPVVTVCHDAILRYKRNYYQEPNAVRQLHNCIQSDDFVFYTKLDRDMFARECGVKWASPSQVKRIQSRDIVYAPMDFSYVEEFGKKEGLKRRRDRDTVVFGYHSSFLRKKKPLEIVEMISKIRALHDVTMNVTSMQKSIPSFMNKPWITSTLNVGRSEYTPYLFDCDICIVGSENETGGRSHWEELAAGNVLVFKDEPWIHEYIPDWYPYVGETWEDVAEISLYVVRNLEEARQKIPSLLEHVKNIVSAEHSSEILYNVMRKTLPEKPSMSLDSSLGSLVKSAIDKLDKDRISLMEVNDTIKEVSRNGRAFLENRHMSPKLLGRLIESAGYVDAFDAPVPEYIRRDADNENTC